MRYFVLFDLMRRQNKGGYSQLNVPIVRHIW
ncbi:hypothetical protein AGR6A_pTi0044 [Agrobacterium sp. NCPPB 925]|nr:hypothetical protein AGR6A_pTi0044 [Agrobacterium sp. NCPPB 925]